MSFFSATLFSKKGVLGKIWLAGNHWDKQVTKKDVEKTNIETSVSDIVSPSEPLALRISGQLLLGIARIYQKKLKYLQDDASEALTRIKLSFRSSTEGKLNAEDGGVEFDGNSSLKHTKKNINAKEKNITLNEELDVLDYQLPQIPVEALLAMSQEDALDFELFGSSFGEGASQRSRSRPRNSSIRSQQSKNTLLQEGDMNYNDIDLDLDMDIDRLVLSLDSENALLSDIELPRRDVSSEGLGTDEISLDYGKEMDIDVPLDLDLDFGNQSFKANSEFDESIPVQTNDDDRLSLSLNLDDDVMSLPHIEVKRSRRKRYEILDEVTVIDARKLRGKSTVLPSREMLPSLKRAKILVEITQPQALNRLISMPSAFGSYLSKELVEFYCSTTASIAEEPKKTFEVELPRQTEDSIAEMSFADSGITGNVTDLNLEQELYNLDSFEDQIKSVSETPKVEDFENFEIDDHELPTLELDLDLNHNAEFEDAHDDDFMNSELARDEELVSLTRVSMTQEAETETETDAGWSERTKKAYDLILSRMSDNQIEFQQILSGKGRRAAAVMFHETLVLKSKDMVSLHQEKPFANIIIHSKNLN